MNVTACLVTRGDVDMQPVLDSLPAEWEKVVWNNGGGCVDIIQPERATVVTDLLDLSVYGRYAAIEYASNDLIYIQDDDVIVKDPQAIVEAWLERVNYREVICNMPQEFRHDFYADHALVGFGAVFHLDVPNIAFGKFWEGSGWLSHFLVGLNDIGEKQKGSFIRTCDVVFTALTPRVLVDVPITHREFASDPGRMWTTPGHQQERKRMLNLAKQVR